TRFSRDWSSDVCSSDLLPDGVAFLRVRPDSALIGNEIDGLDLKAYEGVRLVAVQPVTPADEARWLRDGDVLIVHGPAGEVRRLEIGRASRRERGKVSAL